MSTWNRFPKPAKGLIVRAEGRIARSSIRPHRAIEYLESFSETSRAPAAHRRVGDVSEEVPFASVFVLVYLVNPVVHQLLIADQAMFLKGRHEVHFESVFVLLCCVSICTCVLLIAEYVMFLSKTATTRRSILRQNLYFCTVNRPFTPNACNAYNYGKYT